MNILILSFLHVRPEESFQQDYVMSIITPAGPNLRCLFIHDEAVHAASRGVLPIKIRGLVKVGSNQKI